MRFNKDFYDLLRSDRDDARRAEALDEVYAHLSDEEKEWCKRAVSNAQEVDGIGEKGAKALALTLLLLYHMKVDEQDKWRAHGERVLAAFEWAFPTVLRSKLSEELV